MPVVNWCCSHSHMFNLQHVSSINELTRSDTRADDMTSPANGNFLAVQPCSRAAMISTDCMACYSTQPL